MVDSLSRFEEAVSILKAAPGPVAVDAERAAMKYYTVRSGDTLSKIARNNGTTIKELCRLNGINQNATLRIGRRLRVR